MNDLSPFALILATIFGSFLAAILAAIPLLPREPQEPPQIRQRGDRS